MRKALEDFAKVQDGYASRDNNRDDSWIFKRNWPASKDNIEMENKLYEEVNPQTVSDFKREIEKVLDQWGGRDSVSPNIRLLFKRTLNAELEKLKPEEVTGYQMADMIVYITEVSGHYFRDYGLSQKMIELALEKDFLFSSEDKHV